jgi:A/G-specific adenine glycosylase
MTRAASTSVKTRLAREEWRIRAFRRLLLGWFRREGRSFPWRNPSASRYAQVVSEILLQRTRAETVAEFSPRFIKRFPGWNHLALATEKELRTFLEPIGLWRRRAASLRALAKEMQSRKGRFPATREEIESLPGVGQYVASAAMVFCHGAREPLLDVNMARVLERCFAPRKLVDIRYDPWLQALARAVINDRSAREINWAVLDLAATVCTIRNPRRAACPLQACCRSAVNGRCSNDDKRDARQTRAEVTVSVRRGGKSRSPRATSTVREMPARRG